MFKHGIAYLERGGPADGPFELSFRRGEINDVLKSLAIWVGSGNARVGSVTFEAPEDPAEALAARAMKLDAGSALEHLLQSFSGRTVRVHTSSGPVDGALLGVETMERQALVLRTELGCVRLVSLSKLEGIELLEPSNVADLEYLLDRERAAKSGDVRKFHVSLTGHADDLRIAYVLPAPAWRMSYRLVRHHDATLLMGWAVVHNPTDEDLDEVELTLSAQQPVSFVVDLYRPSTSERAVVEADLGTVASPTRTSEDEPARAGAIDSGATALEGAQAGMGTLIMMAAADAAPARGERREPFEQRLSQRVSIKRGSSALVPVVATTIRASGERLWREAHGPYPELVLSFVNTSLAALDDGPAVIYEAQAYAGEAMLERASRGETVRLGYARDPAIRCRKNAQQDTQVTAVRLAQGAVVEELRRQELLTFVAENDHAEAIELIVEHPRHAQRTLDPAHAQPIDETSAARRFLLQAPAQGQGELVVAETWPDTRHLRYEQLTARDLTGWLEARHIDRQTHDALSGVLSAWGQARSLDEHRARVEREQQESFLRRQKLADQLTLLKDHASEAPARQRITHDMDREQERIAHCEAEVRKLREAAEQARRLAAQTLSVLVAHAGHARRDKGTLVPSD